MVESRHGDWARCGAAVVVAIAARVAIHLTTPLATPMSDMAEYWERGLYIYTHGALYPNSWRMPGLPSALALALAGTGPTMIAARLVNIAAGALTVALTYAVARRVASGRAALTAALVVALYPTFLLYTSLVATESLVTVPVLAAILATSYGSLRAYAALGVMTALATLVRPAGIALLPVALAVPPLTRRDAGAGRPPWGLCVIVTVAGFALAMTPWWLHTVRQHGRLVPLDTTGGINLLIGNSPLTTGTFKWANVVRLHNEFLPGVDTTTPDGSDRAASLALANLRAAPGRFVATAPAKLGALFGLEGREHAYLYSVGYLGTATSSTVWIWGAGVLAAFPLLVVAALTGLTVRAPLPPVTAIALAFVGTSAAMHLLSFGDPRFHLPFVPLLAVIATRLEQIGAGVHRWRTILAGAIVVALALAWAPQLATYLDALHSLAAPGGSSRPLSYDDLL